MAKHLIRILLSMAIIAIDQVICKNLPELWWLDSKGIPIDNPQKFQEFVEPESGQFANHHLFIDVYMENCPYCYSFQDDWNDLVQLMETTYGHKQVAFFQMNKDTNMDLCRRYGVRGFPSFVYVKAGSNGKIATKFQGSRSYESLLQWMQKLLKMNGGVKMIDDDMPIFEKNADELEDALLDEEDEEEDQQQNQNSGIGIRSKIAQIVDKNTGEAIDFEVEKKNVDVGQDSDEKTQQKKFELLMYYKIMNDLHESEVKLGNMSTKFTDSDHEVQQNSESVLSQMNELHSKLYVAMNTLDSKKVLQGDSSADESLDTQVITKAQESESFSSTSSSLIYAVGGFVIGAISGLFIVQIVRRKTMSKGGGSVGVNKIAQGNSFSQKLN